MPCSSVMTRGRRAMTYISPVMTARTAMTSTEYQSRPVKARSIMLAATNTAQTHQTTTGAGSRNICLSCEGRAAGRLRVFSRSQAARHQLASAWLSGPRAGAEFRTGPRAGAEFRTSSANRGEVAAGGQLEPCAGPAAGGAAEGEPRPLAACSGGTGSCGADIADALQGSASGRPFDGVLA